MSTTTIPTIRLLVLLFLILSACGQQSESTHRFINPKARQLNDSAASVVINEENYEKAILLLDKAIQFDSSYAPALTNKFSYQMQLKQYEKALITAKHINRIYPQSSIHFVATGMVYENLGDTNHSKIYFSEAAKYFDKTLDTMSIKNKMYDGVRMNKAINLIFFGQEQQGNQLLEQISNGQKDNFMRESISHFMHKSKRQIINSFIQSDSTMQSE